MNRKSRKMTQIALNVQDLQQLGKQNSQFISHQVGNCIKRKPVIPILI